MLQQDEPWRADLLETSPKAFPRQEPSQGTAAEVYSQVGPSGGRTGNQVGTSFMVPCWFGFDVWVLGGVWIWY